MAVMTDEQLETVAFSAFCRNMEAYEFEPGMLQLAFYGDEGVREFWIAEARAWRAAFDDVNTERG